MASDPQSPPDFPAIWEAQILPRLKPYWPMPVNDTLSAPGNIGHVEYMEAYVAIYNAGVSSPRPALGPTSPLVSVHLDALILEWTRAVRLYVGTDLQRYLAAWRNFQIAFPFTSRLFSGVDRHHLPLKGKTLEELARLPLEREVCSSATALRRWRTEVVLPLFGNMGSIPLPHALPAGGDERKSLVEELRASFLACGVAADDEMVIALSTV
ncbi:hypothetical protein EXIGLDRAFT_721559 [Exidia glandulosa HHB12029]|uniref:Uncharacterized protein n=1 Tax=Exidia glandulosa HHB12029 TaxID=1314781 RepID=A0A165FMJ1_EXIGL|nr:hypothetical protein EXIGLDRAFT_721559 [Exidia glandulosa HHB12029]